MAAVADAILQQIAVVDDLRIRRREGLDDRQRPAGGAARCVEREVGGGAEPFDARAVLTPFSQARRPFRCLGGGKRLRRLAGPARFVGIDPRREIRRRQARECEQQVAEVALRIDRDHGDAVDRRFFDQADAKTGLAAAGHAGDHGVRDEVRRIVKKRCLTAGPGFRVDLPAEVEQAKLFEVGH